MTLKVPEKYLSITELNFLLNKFFEEEFSNVSFKGEISEFLCAASGHLYLTIKDDQSQVSAVMWRSTSTRLRFQPKVGDVVICKGTPNVYNKTGRMQFILQQIIN